jgi:hypothetical protein
MRVRVAVAVTYRMHEQLSSINVGGSVVTTNPAACNITFSRQAGLCSETASRLPTLKQMVYLTGNPVTSPINASNTSRQASGCTPSTEESKQTLRKSKFPGCRQIRGGYPSIQPHRVQANAEHSCALDRLLAPGAFPGLPTKPSQPDTSRLTA